MLQCLFYTGKFQESFLATCYDICPELAETASIAYAINGCGSKVPILSHPHTWVMRKEFQELFNGRSNFELHGDGRLIRSTISLIRFAEFDADIKSSFYLL